MIPPQEADSFHALCNNLITLLEKYSEEYPAVCSHIASRIKFLSKQISKVHKGAEDSEASSANQELHRDGARAAVTALEGSPESEQDTDEALDILGQDIGKAQAEAHGHTEQDANTENNTTGQNMASPESSSNDEEDISTQRQISSDDAAEATSDQWMDAAHDVDDGILRLRPTFSQWSRFDYILRQAKSLGAKNAGFFKVVVPGVGPLKESHSDSQAYSYSIHRRADGTVNLELKEDTFVPSSPGVRTDLLSASDAFAFFEQSLDENDLQKSRYRTDASARTDTERETLGLPASPIWPLAGDRLKETRYSIAGMHWPYAYESNGAFGCPFALHQEDWLTYSINYLHKGTRAWCFIPPSAADQLEKKFRANNGKGLPSCAQFIRHSAIYVPTGKLEAWEVPYKLADQYAGEALITFPRTYHQGISKDKIVAEAVNYAAENWSPELYSPCKPRSCPPEMIGRDKMELRRENEEQFSERDCSDDESNNDQDNGESATPVPETGTKQGSRIKHIKKNEFHSIKPQKRRNEVKFLVPRKHLKTGQLSQKELSGAFDSVISAPQIEPWTIFNRFLERSTQVGVSFDQNRCYLLTRFFYAIASPDAFSQLRDACEMLRAGKFHISRSTDGVASATKALDGLETSIHVASVLRRYHLVTLHDSRSRLQTSLKATPKRTKTKVNEDMEADDVSKRSSSQMLVTMMAEAYPKLKPTRTNRGKDKDDYNQKLRTLQDRLMAGHRWSKLAESFDLGILALVPTQGDYQLSNTECVSFLRVDPLLIVYQF